MPISAELLPTQLHYIIPLAERFGIDAPVSHFDDNLGRHVKFAEKLSPDDIKSLSKMYIEMCDKEHGTLINDWYHEAVKNKYPAETTWPIWGLFSLFGQLASLGIAPFSDRVISYKEKPIKLDWSKLPPGLRDLAGPAEKYGHYQFELAIYDYFDSKMSAEDRIELQALNRRIGKDWKAVQKWLDEFPMTEHREAALVYFTMSLLGLGCDGGYL